MSEKYNSLSFVAVECYRRPYTYCRWKCDCGNEVIIPRTKVVNGYTKSCGCSRKQSKSKLWRGKGELSKTLWSRIRSNAKSRGWKLKITLDEAWDLFLKQNRKCALTGENLRFQTKHQIPDGTASLDRIDSSKDYTIDNIQWVHKDVNKMKGNLSNSRFLDLCQKVIDKSQVTSSI